MLGVVSSICTACGETGRLVENGLFVSGFMLAWVINSYLDTTYHIQMLQYSTDFYSGNFYFPKLFLEFHVNTLHY